jgi:hypothetical protein
MARKPKGYRTLSVDGQQFFWRLTPERYEWLTSKERGFVKVIPAGEVSRLEVRLTWLYADCVTPSDMEALIRLALEKWDPKVRGTVRLPETEVSELVTVRRKEAADLQLCAEVMLS